MIAGRRLRAASAAAGLWWALSVPVAAGEAGVDLRVVDETVPPGGLALIRVELTEPKPISGGRVRLGAPPSLGRVVGAAVLNRSGDLKTQVLSLDGEAVLQFESSDSSLGTDPELPVLVVAVEVLASAQPGHTETLSLDLPESLFLDPQGNPYPVETQSGVLTIGGLSVTNVEPLEGSLAAGETIRLEGVNFDPEVDVNIEGANLSEVRVDGSTSIEALLAGPFQLRGTTRIRLRSPDGAEEFFYTAVLIPPPANRPPLARDDSVVTPEDTPLEIEVLANDSDPDGQTIALASVGQPSNGSAQQLDSRRVRYDPAPDFFGADSFVYEVRDSAGAAATGTVRVQVLPVNDFPEAVTDEVVTAVDTPISFSPLANDRDADLDPVAITSLSAPISGALFEQPDGQVLYVPHPLFEGMDVAGYRIRDLGGSEAEGQILLEVRRPDEAPVARDDARTALPEADTPLDVLANDFDPEGEPLQVAVVQGPGNGVVTGQGGALSYRSNPGFVGTDTVRYSISDPAGSSAEATVRIAVNDPLASRFEPGQLETVAGAVERVPFEVGALAGAGEEPVALVLESSPAGLLEHPAEVQLAVGESRVEIPVRGLADGTATLTVRGPGADSRLPVAVNPGRRWAVPTPGQAAGPRVGLALTNRGAAELPFQLRAYPGGGERQVVLQSRGQQAFLLDDPGFFSGLSGWVEVAAASPDAFAAFLSVGTPVRGFSGASGLSRDRRWVVPLELAAEHAATLSLINDSARESLVRLSLAGGSGQTLEEFRLGSGEARSLSVAELGLTGSQEVLAVESEEPLSAFFEISSDSFLYGHAPRLQEDADELFVAHAVSGQGWFTELALINAEAEERRVRLEWTDSDATPTTAVRVVELTLPAGATRLVRPGPLLLLPEEEVRSGSMVLNTGGGVRAFAQLGRSGPRPLQTSVPVLAGLAREALFAQAASGNFGAVRLFTGLAFHNPSPVDSIVILDVYGRDGALVGHSAFRLEAGTRLSALLADLVPLEGPLPGGYLRVRSTEPVALVEIFGDFASSFLATVDPASP